jgi:acyl carrier protein
MTEEETRQIIFKLLKNIAPDTTPEQLKPDDNIRHTLGIDSFDYLQFIIGLDETLGIKTGEEDYGKIETLRSLLDYILKKKTVDSFK